MMKVFETLDQWKIHRNQMGRGETLGFVPTMGALHPGHASLISQSRAQNDRTAVSIFVNPTQFNDPRDLEKYPRNLKRDLEILESQAIDCVICPKSFEELYPDRYRYQIGEKELSLRLCGAHRPGHFDGVLTVVMKLLNLVRPNRAYFGEKDFQQLSLIQGMVEAFFMQVQIIPCPTLREKDGLAMSSRNALLSDEERKRAALFPSVLSNPGLSLGQARIELEKAGFKVDYLEEIRGRRYGAVQLGAVRLIDNFALNPSLNS